MMNGTKKSDSSIVPAKPANKAERSTAELVEGDDGTKRNVELQSTVRTQSREAVTQAQARIRGAITRNEKEKLTALLHHVSIDVLRWAFFNIKKQAAPGVDGLTWVDYAADLDQNLTDLHARVHSGAYRALPSRRDLCGGRGEILVPTATIPIIQPLPAPVHFRGMRSYAERCRCDCAGYTAGRKRLGENGCD
jgi:hypothetical protein